MDLGIEGKFAAVAASTSGLGFAAAQALAREGVNVAICGRDRVTAERAAAKIGRTTVPIIADVATQEGAVEFTAEAQRQLGQIDILVINAPGTPTGTFATIEPGAFAPALESHILSVVAMCRSVLGAMQERRWGRVVAITSSGVRQPIPDLILSNTGRTGLTAFLKTVALEVAAHEITVNSVQPGYHRTQRLVSWAGNDRLKELALDVPARRLGDAEDLGALVAFLCSQSARYITGAAIPVDGGLSRGLM